MTEHFKTFLIGLFVIIACISVVLALLFLRPTVGDEGQILRVRFTNISGVDIGTRVTFAGKPVGEVIAIRIIDDAREQKVDKKGKAFYYELELAVDSHVKIFDSDVIAIHTSGLLGERSISIIPIVPENGKPAKRIQGKDIVYGQSEDPVDEALDNLASIGEKANAMLDSLTKLIDVNAPEIEQTIKSIHAASSHLDQMLVEAVQVKLVTAVQDMAVNVSTFANAAGKITASLHEKDFGKNFGELTESLASIMDAINDPEILKLTLENIHQISLNLKDALPDLQQTLQNANAISTAMAEGKSTLGKLMTQDDLYAQLCSVLSRIDLLMSDINNYGVLFHNNKGWQRQKSNRSTDCPDPNTACNAFLQSQVDQLQLALMRIASTLDKTQGDLPDRLRGHFKDSLLHLKGKMEKLDEKLTAHSTE